MNSPPTASSAAYPLAGGAPPNGALPRPAFLVCSCAALCLSRLGPFLLELFEGVSFSTLPKTEMVDDSGFKHSHDSPANHADDQHERPARNQSEREHHISDDLVDAKLRQFPIERLEEAFVQDALFILLARMQCDDVADGGLCDV